jgi:hypothetical protein
MLYLISNSLQGGGDSWLQISASSNSSVNNCLRGWG